jgi:hypothetical protein
VHLAVVVVVVLVDEVIVEEEGLEQVEVDAVDAEVCTCTPLIFLYIRLIPCDFQLQVVAVGVEVGVEVEIEVVGLVVEEEEAVEEAAEEPKEAQRLFLSLTDILVFLLPKAKTICWSLKISSPANPYMARNGYLLKVV